MWNGIQKDSAPSYEKAGVIERSISNGEASPMVIAAK